MNTYNLQASYCMGVLGEKTASQMGQIGQPLPTLRPHHPTLGLF